jgi:hypothetical protein
MKKIIASVLAGSPLLALAQPLTDINSVATKATNIGNLIIGLAISIAILWIIVSVVRFLIVGSNDEAKRAEGKNAIIYGVIGLFLILSIWGLVAILRNSFRTQDQTPVNEINRTTTLPQPGYVPN